MSPNNAAIASLHTDQRCAVGLHLMDTEHIGLAVQAVLRMFIYVVPGAADNGPR